MTNFSKGDIISVKYKAVKYENGGRTKKTVTREDIGTVKCVPSQKFEGYNFDYELKRGKAVRSVNLEENIVEQLIYEAGGDMESERWVLESVSKQ